jgi:D-3-phosphoglycerate dehydrogenase / 2-oxoglutarate reductase
MTKVLFTPEAFLHIAGRHTEILTEAGLNVAYPKNPHMARGACNIEETIAELSDVEAVIAGTELFNAEILDHLPRLRVIARYGVGYDRVDVAAATQRNILVTITPTAVHESAAEHALALLFAVSRNIPSADRATRAGEWPRDIVQPVRGKTLGIVGLGRIGLSLATRAAALGMTVIAYDEFPNAELARKAEVQLVDFDTLVRTCDVMSIHCPINERTRGIINRDVLSRMKPTAILINTARGPIVNEADLIDALRDGTIKAAGLDVFEVEPPASDNPLFAMSNVVLTPHAAGADALSMQNMANESASCVAQLFQGIWPTGAVINTELREHWKW